jgi:GPI-anchor transamidase subunit GAA1
MSLHTKLKAFFVRSDSNSDPNAIRLRRRKALVSVISRRLPVVRSVFSSLYPFVIFNQNHRLCLFIIGYLWMAAIPLPRLSRGTYIDENALQPGQVRFSYFVAGLQNQLD